MRSVVLSVLLSLLTNLLVLYLFLYHYVKVVDGARIVGELSAGLTEDVFEGNAELAARKKVLIYRAFSLALREQKGIVFVSQSVFKAPFEDVTDEVLERTRYWYAYLLTAPGALSPEAGGQPRQKP